MSTSTSTGTSTGSSGTSSGTTGSTDAGVCDGGPSCTQFCTLPGGGQGQFCTTSSGTTCVDLTTNDNCGTCGHFCEPTYGCGIPSGGSAYTCLPPTVCVSAPCADSGPNSAQCDGNVSLFDDGGMDGGNGVCTATEAAFVTLDLENDNFGPDAGCYYCLWQAGCLDDGFYQDTDHECADLDGVPAIVDAGGQFFNGQGVYVAAVSTCLQTLQCIIDSRCSDASNDALDCYCGAGMTSTACDNTTNPTGVCLTPELNGFKYNNLNPTQLLLNFTDTSEPSGMANQIFTCAAVNNCTACFDTRGSH